MIFHRANMQTPVLTATRIVAWNDKQGHPCLTTLRLQVRIHTHSLLSAQIESFRILKQQQQTDRFLVDFNCCFRSQCWPNNGTKKSGSKRLMRCFFFHLLLLTNETKTNIILWFSTHLLACVCVSGAVCWANNYAKSNAMHWHAAERIRVVLSGMCLHDCHHVCGSVGDLLNAAAGNARQRKIFA